MITVDLNELDKMEGRAIYELQHTFELSDLKINLLKLHAPMSDERAIPNRRLQSSTVSPDIHL